MIHGRSRALSALAVMIGVGLLSPPVGASAPASAELLADYRLQGDRSSTTGAAALTDLGPGNTFTDETVDGVSQKVLAFKEQAGLSMPAPHGIFGYSIVMLVRLVSVDGYHPLVDFGGGAFEAGLYVHDGKLAWLFGAEGTRANIRKNRYVQVVLTHASTGRKVVGYVDGKKSFTLKVHAGEGIINGSIRLLNGTFNVASAGAVARIRFYWDALTPTEIAALGREPA